MRAWWDKEEGGVRSTRYSGKEVEICRTGTRDSETKVEGCSRGTLVANALAGQVEGKTPQSSGRERVCALPPELNNWTLGQFCPWHHLPGKQGKDGSKVTRGHWEALSSHGLLGCPPSDLGYFRNCAARTPPTPFRGQWLLMRTFSQGIVSLISLLLGTSPNCLRASSVWAVPSALWVLGPGISHQMAICHPHLDQVPEHPLQ